MCWRARIMSTHQAYRLGLKFVVFPSCLLIAWAASDVAKGELDCRSGAASPVVDVLDGDTIVLARGSYEHFRVRIFGIDAPERANAQSKLAAQPYGDEAAKFTRNLLVGRVVCARMIGHESHGRFVGDVRLDGVSVGQALVEAGLAWWDHKRAPQDKTLKRLERTARENGVGLWSDIGAVPPWEWRFREPPR